MKYIMGILLLTTIGCTNGNRKSGNTPINDFNLEGIWQLEATKISPGGPVEWTTVDSKTSYSFHSDATFTYEVPENTEYNKSGTFSVSDEALYLSYIRNNQEVNDKYYIQFDNGKLILQFFGCIEECKERYVSK